MPGTRQLLVEQYRQLLAEVYTGYAATPAPVELPPELSLQSKWAAGILPREGYTQRHGSLRILDIGRWNRQPGPDFTHAEIELNGERLRGDIELDPCAQDWERHGHGANPGFDNVVLHVVFTPPPAGWYTRNSQHRDIPLLYLPPECWQHTASAPAETDSLPRCRQPLADMPAGRIQRLLQAAAAYRMEQKRTRFRQRVAAAGRRQAWFEAWATTLGYSANKDAMLMLAMRAPIAELGPHSEAILLGTAGFLFPALPDSVGADARQYHRKVWDSWWLLREQFELCPGRHLPWSKAPSRPLNHPQRRVAALAATAPLWNHLLPLCSAAGAAELSSLLCSVRHPFWDTHYTLSAAPMKNRAALIGQSRITDFLINYVYVNDEAPHAWESYIRVKQGDLPTGIDRTAWHLFGDRADLKSTLRCAYAQQALLQIDADFCARNICLECAFPAQLCQWAH